MCVYTELADAEELLFSTSRLIDDMARLLKDAERLLLAPRSDDSVQTASEINDFLRDM